MDSASQRSKKRSEQFRSGARATIITIAVMMITSACVSVNIAPKGGERSKGVSFQPPTPPYKDLDDTKADGAWQNEKNGNSISYFSTCNDPADPSLEIISTELFSEIRDLNIVRRNHTQFNGREALDMEVEGKVEGIATRVHALIFKKNGCTYTLSHVGLTRGFEPDRPHFKAFMGSFQAP